MISTQCGTYKDKDMCKRWSFYRKVTKLPWN